jgi:hypothetical protein
VAHTTVPTVDRAPAPNIVFLRPCIHEHQKQQMQAAEDKGKRCNAPLTVWDTPKLTLGSRADIEPSCKRYHASSKLHGSSKLQT